MSLFNGLGMGLHNISQLSNAQTRSISAENFTGEKGRGGMATVGNSKNCARELGQGWKVSPCIQIPANGTFRVADIEGSGCIQHIWFTTEVARVRSMILRIFWDGEEEPSVCVPLGDFFCNGWTQTALINSMPIVVNPAFGLNSYWPMPFKKRAVIEIENLKDSEVVLFYQVDYTLTEVPDNEAYFHASFRREHPTEYMRPYTILDNIKGKGHFVGVYMAWQPNSNGWWGEGEIKFYMDGDTAFPTICGTGTEDYFGGAWNWEFPRGQYGVYSTPFLGVPQIIKPDGLYNANMRFGLYRFHIMDPIRFENDLRVTIQALGWRSDGRYLPLQDDIASTAFWYQSHPHAPLAALPDANGLEVI